MTQLNENNINTSQSTGESSSVAAPRRSDPKKRDRKKTNTEKSVQPAEKKEVEPQPQVESKKAETKQSDSSKSNNKKKEEKTKKEEKKKEEKKKDDKKSKENKKDKKKEDKKDSSKEKSNKKEEKSKSDKKEKEKKEKTEKQESKVEKETTEKSYAVDTLQPVNDTTTVIDSSSIDSIITVADSSSLKTKTDTVTIAPYLSGNEPMARTNHPGHDSGIMMLLAFTFILVSFSFKYYRRMLSTYGQDLWNVRNRANAFDEHTSNEHSVIGILIFQLCVYAGLLISAKINSIIPINPDKIMLTTCCMMGTYGLYYLFQLAIYSMVGYVFADKNGATQWIKGFNASQIFLGFTLILPSVISIFYPTTSGAMLTIASILYVVARLTFIFKGFRIFYKNLYSLFYFILYLCTLEIIPIIFVYKIAQIFFGNLQ